MWNIHTYILIEMPIQVLFVKRDQKLQGLRDGVFNWLRIILILSYTYLCIYNSTYLCISP